MTPSEKTGLWLLRLVCFCFVGVGCLLLEFTSDVHVKFTEQFGFIPEEQWGGYVVTATVMISALITFLITMMVSGKAEAIWWIMQILCFLVLFTGFFYLIPERWGSFPLVFGFSLATTSGLIFSAAKRKEIKQAKD